MKKKGATKRHSLTPQIYEPCCEIELEALAHGLAGTQQFAPFLTEPSGPDCGALDRYLKGIEGGMCARFWLNKRKKL